MNVYDVRTARWNPAPIQPQFGFPTIKLPVKLVASATYLKGTLIGELTGTAGTFGAYASGNSDGSQVATALLDRDYVTDSSGNIFAGQQATSEDGDSVISVDAYFAGCFSASDIVNIDSAGLTALKGRLLRGTLTGSPATGFVKF